MFGFTAKVENKLDRVRQAAEKGAFRSFSRAAFAIRQTAIDSIEQASGPSAPGEPPHTHRRMFLRRAIRYAANREGAVIGPRHSVVGAAGEAHEFGGEYRGNEYPARPFMFPALQANLDRFAGSWAGSIGE